MKKDTEKNFRLIVTVGLPYSGKTTWAQSLAGKTPVPIVNPDSIRLALHGHRFVALAEPFVWAIAKVMVHALFLAGHTTVVLDACNGTRKRRDLWQSEEWETRFHYVDTPEAECVQRAGAEDDGEIFPVIERMAAEFEPLEADEIAF